MFVDIDNSFKNYRHYNSDQRGNGAIFTCGGFSFATIWCVNSFFLFDSHIDGFNDLNGRAVLLEFRTMMFLNNFIKCFFENCTGVSLEMQYDLQYIGVQISDNLKQEILHYLQRKRKSLHNKVYQTKKIVDPTSIFWQNQEHYSNNADRILNDRKQYYVNNLDKIRDKGRTYYAKNIESIRKKNQVYKSNNVKIIKLQNHKYFIKSQRKIQKKQK